METNGAIHLPIKVLWTFILVPEYADTVLPVQANWSFLVEYAIKDILYQS